MDFFTDPWNISLAQWTMFEISSALLQVSLTVLAIKIAFIMWLDKK